MGSSRGGLGVCTRHVWNCDHASDGVVALFQGSSPHSTFSRHNVDASLRATPVWDWGVISGNPRDDRSGSSGRNSLGNDSGNLFERVCRAEVPRLGKADVGVAECRADGGVRVLCPPFLDAHFAENLS